MIGLYALDMWSVLFVMYVGGMIKYSDWNERTGYVVSVVCSVYGCWYVGGIIKYSVWNEHTGHVVSVVCSMCGCWDLI